MRADTIAQPQYTYVKAQSKIFIVSLMYGFSLAVKCLYAQVLSFTHPVSFHSAETFESLLGCLKMDDEKVAEAALQIFKNTGNKLEESFPHIKSYVWVRLTAHTDQKSTSGFYSRVTLLDLFHQFKSFKHAYVYWRLFLISWFLRCSVTFNGNLISILLYSHP